MCDVVVKGSRSLSHLLMSSCLHLVKNNPEGVYDYRYHCYSVFIRNIYIANGRQRAVVSNMTHCVMCQCWVVFFLSRTIHCSCCTLAISDWVTAFGTAWRKLDRDPTRPLSLFRVRNVIVYLSRVSVPIAVLLLWWYFAKDGHCCDGRHCAKTRTCISVS